MPLLCASTGETVAELSGVMNVSIEGQMMLGAMSAFVVAGHTGNLWLGVAAGILVAVLLSLLFGLLTISIRINQIVIGLALALLGTGVANYVGTPYVGTSLPRTFEPISLPLLGQIPFVGPVFFNQNVLIYLAYVLVPVIGYVVYRTKLGLALRAVGERPRAADVVGIDVIRVRYVAVAVGGAMSGLAGAYLSLGWLNGWTENMTGGRGWIALALVIVGAWSPYKMLPIAYILGMAYVMAVQVQTIQKLADLIPNSLVQMVPYLAAIAVLAVAGRRDLRRGRGSPASLTIPYSREER